MTRQYQIQKITGKPDWNKIEKAPIDQKLWLPCEQISAYAQLAYDDSRLYVRLHAEEPTIRAENTGMLDQPCQDSCLEFFFSAAEQDARYINIELNPSLCIYFGFGTGREDLMRIAISSGVDGIFVEADESEELTELIDEAVDRDIPVVTLYGDNTHSKRCSFVAVPFFLSAIPLTLSC